MLWFVHGYHSVHGSILDHFVGFNVTLSHLTTRWRPMTLVVGGNLAPFLFALIPC